MRDWDAARAGASGAKGVEANWGELEEDGRISLDDVRLCNGHDHVAARRLEDGASVSAVGRKVVPFPGCDFDPAKVEEMRRDMAELRLQHEQALTAAVLRIRGCDDYDGPDGFSACLRRINEIVKPLFDAEYGER